MKVTYHDLLTFNLKSLFVRDSNTGYKYEVNLTIEMDSKTFNKFKAKRDLGWLYGVGISNAIYDINPMIPASRPMVDDSKRASKGIKTIRLTYHFNETPRAEALGIEHHKLADGLHPKYGQCINLMPSLEFWGVA